MLFIKSALQQLSRIYTATLQWLPSYCRISGNEKADSVQSWQQNGAVQSPRTYREAKTIIHNQYNFQFPCHLGNHILSSRVDLVHAVFLCVQTTVWLTMLGIFDAHVDFNAFDCTWRLHKHCNRICTESSSWEKNPCCAGELNLHQQCAGPTAQPTAFSAPVLTLTTFL